MRRARKTARLVSSSPKALKELRKCCGGRHVQAPLPGGRAAAAAVYPPGLSRAILRGIATQRRADGDSFSAAAMTGRGLYELGAGTEVKLGLETEGDLVGDEEEACQEVMGEDQEWYRSGWGGQSTGFWDVNTGEPPPADLSSAARLEEIGVMLDWKVWDEVPTEECRRRMVKRPLGGKWGDINTADVSRAQPECGHGGSHIPQRRVLRRDPSIGGSPAYNVLGRLRRR